MRGGAWKGAAPLVPRFACQDRRSAVLALNGHAACTYTATSWPCEDTEGTHETEGEGAREEAADAPRLALAYEVARRLVYLSGPEFPELPVVQAAKKLESLLPSSRYRRVSTSSSYAYSTVWRDATWTAVRGSMIWPTS